MLMEIEATFEKTTKSMVRYTTVDDGTFYFKQHRFDGEYPEKIIIVVKSCE